MWCENSSCTILLFSGRFKLKLSQDNQNLHWKYRTIFFLRPKTKIPTSEGSNIFFKEGTWYPQLRDPVEVWTLGFVSPGTSTNHIMSVHPKLKIIIGITDLFQWSRDTMDVKVFCKLDSAIQMTATSCAHSAISPSVGFRIQAHRAGVHIYVHRHHQLSSLPGV